MASCSLRPLAHRGWTLRASVPSMAECKQKRVAFVKVINLTNAQQKWS
jgi:hypothetical protein